MTPDHTFTGSGRNPAQALRTGASAAPRLFALVWPFVAIVALLLASATVSLWMLSGLRAYVNAEALWSKAQKEAVLHLEHYARSGEAAHYQRFVDAIDVTLGDRIAREELDKTDYRFDVASDGLRRGGNHPDDIPGMIALVRYFRGLGFVDRAIKSWEQADGEIVHLLAAARRIDEAMRQSATPARLEELAGEVEGIDDRLRPLENAFSATLGEGSRWTERTLIALMIAAGALMTAVGLIQANRLIGTSQAIELALRASEARFHALTDLTSDWYWEQDEHFRFVDVTPRAGGPTGFPPGEHVGKTRWELASIEMNDEQWRLHRAELESHRPFRELEYCRTDVHGNIVWVSISGEPRFDAAGGFAGYRGTGKIITDRKRAELEVQRLNRELESRVRVRTAELEAANEELESFAYSIAHDLAAPLRNINGRVSQLVEDCAGDLGPQGMSAVARVREATVRMGRIIDDMLRLSMAGRREMKRTSVDLSQIAGSIVADLRGKSPEREVDTRIAQLPEAFGDRDLLRIALEHLIGNAWKFSSGRARAEIEFRSETRDGEQWYFVRDNGTGFDIAYLDRIFKPFYRLHDERVFPGNGIGLAIVERVITRHGGRVTADSAPGHGATFRFTLG